MRIVDQADSKEQMATGDDVGAWFALGVFGVICVLSTVAAFFPRWDLRWGRNRGRGPRVSTEGRVAFAVFSGYSVVVILVSRSWSSLSPWLGLVNIPIFASIILIYLRDRRRS